ncbi:MAG: hypothetical protein MJ072_01560, partial [Clostridia bacterium]|nr:hypothetical protein [Clostridia bacterium]
MEGYAAKTALKEIAYSGIGLSGCANLYDFVMSNNKRDYDWYPLVASMSEGTRACAFLGLLSLIKNANLEPEHLYDNYNDIMGIEETAKIATEGISVFYDVDREIYKDGMVAMTGTAVWGSKSGDNSWQRMSDDANKDFLKSSLTRSILKYTACGLGGASAVGIGLVVHFARASYATEVATTATLTAETEFEEVAVDTFQSICESDAMYNILEDQIFEASATYQFDLYNNLKNVQLVYLEELEDIAEASAKTSTVATNVSKTVTNAVKISSVFLGVAIILLIVTLVLYFLLQEEPVLVYEQYAEIPAMLCDYRPVYIGKKIDNDTKKYVYYKVAENPYGVEEKSLFGDSEDIKLLPESKKPAQDIYNWELKGNREWLCVYTTKDANAGFPIKANTLKIDGNKTLSGYSTASLFDSSEEFDVMQFYNGSINTNPTLSNSEKESKRAPNVYLHYVMDTDAKLGTLEDEIIKKNNTLASAISSVPTWGVFLACIVIGTVVSVLVLKKKQKKNNLVKGIMNFRLIKKFSIIALVAVLMAVIMPTSSVLHVVRAARVLPTYVSEVIIVKEGDLQAAEEDGYKIVQNKSKESEPLYNGIENGTSSTYLAYKTTRVASEALTDIRLMNMKGGYSFSEYEKYLSEMKTNAEKLASSMWPAIVEFRTNFNADLPWAKFAYDILNVYTYDDVLEDGKPIRLGKLLLDDTLVSNDECDIIKTLFLESNFNVLNAIYDALSVACSKDLNGDSFIDRLNTVDVDKDATELNDIVYSMESDVADIRESVSYYRTTYH